MYFRKISASGGNFIKILNNLLKCHSIRRIENITTESEYFLQLNSTAIEDDEEDYKDKGKENEGEGPLDRGFPLIPLK